MSSTYWQTQYQSARRKVQELEAERDALRHVVSEARAMGFLTPSAESGADHRALCEFARDLPTSLARRDARVKAEALDGFADAMNPVCEAQDLIVNRAYSMADEYRQQAEGGGDE